MSIISDAGAQSHMIELTAGRFHYLTWGAERVELPPVVLLHGITSSALSWVRVGPALANRYRVYALDLRGHGDSVRATPGSYHLRDTADDAQELIEKLELAQPVLVGHSWGGATALVLASGMNASRPAPALSSVILEDPAIDFSQRSDNMVDYYTRDIGRPADELRHEMVTTSPGWTEIDIEGKIDSLQRVSREAVVSVFNDASSEGKLLHHLAEISAPTLLIRAQRDLGSVIGEAAWEQAQKLLPTGSAAVEIAGATHNVHRSQFAAFMSAVDRFLDRE
jgi:pimeloyl-ACP methyl ester carboxylesterase